MSSETSETNDYYWNLAKNIISPDIDPQNPKSLGLLVDKVIELEQRIDHLEMNHQEALRNMEAQFKLATNILDQIVQRITAQNIDSNSSSLDH